MKTKTPTREEMIQLRDWYHWRAEMELRLHGPTCKFRSLARSYYVISSEVGYPEEDQ